MNGSNYIDGKWLAGQGEAFSACDPFDESTTWQGAAASADQVSAAVISARTAFPAWAGITYERRVELLEAYAELLENNKSELAQLVSAEVGKPLWEATGEIGAMVGKIAVSIKAFEERCGNREIKVAGATSVTRFKPHGVCAVFGPFNFPGHLPNGHIVPALLAGNTVVFKPSEMTPSMGQRMVELFEAAKLPAGVVNLVHGGRDTGIALSGERDLDGLFFTGSSAAGRAIHKNYGGHPDKILALEMGGNNPLVVHSVDDVDAAVYWAIQSAYITSGQRCVCARRMIVTECETNDRFVESLAAAIPNIKIGHFRDEPQPFLGPLISATAAQQVLENQQELIDAGAKTLVLSKASSRSPALLSPGLIDVTGVTDIPDEEIFGPLLQVIRVKDLDAAIIEANKTVYGLAAGIFCTERSDFDRFLHEGRAGIVNWNKATTGATSSAPFGGIGQSGNHNPSAYFATDYCSYPVASMESESLKLPEQRSPGL